MWTWVGRYWNVSILDFVGDEGDGGGGDKWSMGRGKLQSDCHRQQINKQPFPSPNQQRQSAGEKNNVSTL